MSEKEKKLDAGTAGKEKRGAKKVLIGTVTSDKMNKTVVVEVARRVLNRRFGKYLTKITKYKAHSELSEAKTGSKVRIIETKPMSKEKRWKVQSVLQQSRQLQEHSSKGIG